MTDRWFFLDGFGKNERANIDKQELRVLHEVAKKLLAFNDRQLAHALLSQAVFAAVLNTSVSSVQKWEIGDKKPGGPSLKLLNLIERKGIEAVL